MPPEKESQHQQSFSFSLEVFRPFLFLLSGNNNPPKQPDPKRYEDDYYFPNLKKQRDTVDSKPIKALIDMIIGTMLNTVTRMKKASKPLSSQMKKELSASDHLIKSLIFSDCFIYDSDRNFLESSGLFKNINDFLNTNGELLQSGLKSASKFNSAIDLINFLNQRNPLETLIWILNKYEKKLNTRKNPWGCEKNTVEALLAISNGENSKFFEKKNPGYDPGYENKIKVLNSISVLQEYINHCGTHLLKVLKTANPDLPVEKISRAEDLLRCSDLIAQVLHGGSNYVAKP